MKFAIGLIAGFLLAIGFSGRAEDWLVVSGISYHLDRNGQNERNWGAGGEHRLTENNRLGYGAYKNSSNRLSIYLANAYTPYRCLIADCGVIFGLVTGYEQDQKPTVLGGLAATIERGDVGLNLIFIPAAGGVAFAQVKFRW